MAEGAHEGKSAQGPLKSQYWPWEQRWEQWRGWIQEIVRRWKLRRFVIGCGGWVRALCGWVNGTVDCWGRKQREKTGLRWMVMSFGLDTFNMRCLWDLEYSNGQSVCRPCCGQTNNRVLFFWSLQLRQKHYFSK